MCIEEYVHNFEYQCILYKNQFRVHGPKGRII